MNGPFLLCKYSMLCPVVWITSYVAALALSFT